MIFDYKARGFKVGLAFADGAFRIMIILMKQELQVDLTTCTGDPHVPRAENAIRFAKERVRCIQSESPFKRYPKRLTIEMIKRVTVLIDSFNRKSGVHSVMSSQYNIIWKEIQDSIL